MSNTVQYLYSNNPRLEQIEAETKGSPLAVIAMWQAWQKTVKDRLPNFAGSMTYIAQENTDDEYETVAEYVAGCERLVDVRHLATTDAEFGAVVKSTRALGRVTRPWLDAVIESDFLWRNAAGRNCTVWDKQYAWDIGAGYGRFAVVMNVLYPRLSYVCLDAVPISTFICEYYTHRFAPAIEVWTLKRLCEYLKTKPMSPNALAINIHSWNECSLDQIAAWLDVLKHLRIQYLFTVQHDRSYSSWQDDRASCRPLFERQFALVAEEHIGFAKCPHALWRQRIP